MADDLIRILDELETFLWNARANCSKASYTENDVAYKHARALMRDAQHALARFPDRAIAQRIALVLVKMETPGNDWWVDYKINVDKVSPESMIGDRIANLWGVTNDENLRTLILEAQAAEMLQNSGQPQERKPLSPVAVLVYEKLLSLPEHEAMTGPQIMKWLIDTHGKFIDDRQLSRDILEPMKPYGWKNVPKIGYYIPLHARPTK